MMNINHYRTDLLRCMFEGDGFAANKGTICNCSELDCSICDFSKENTHTSLTCEAFRLNWLTKEYVPNPTLTKRQHNFLKLLPGGCRLLQDDIHLKMHFQVPHLNTEITLEYSTYDALFPPLPLTTGKWFNISDMLGWEVKDEE